MITVSVVEAGCMVFVTVVLGWLDEACALQQATTTQMMMGRTIKSTIPAIVPPTAIPTTLPIQKDMINTRVKLHHLPKWISLPFSQNPFVHVHAPKKPAMQ